MAFPPTPRHRRPGRTALGLAFSLAVFSLPIDADTGGDLPLRLTNLRPGRGSVRLCLFDRDDGFPDRADRALRRDTRPVDGTELDFVWTDVPNGDYAVSVYQDLDDNGRLNRNFLGIPREPVGVSRNPPLRRGPPRFTEARFTFTAPLHAPIVIRLPDLPPNLRRRLRLND